MKCSKCGFENDPTLEVCSNCGESLKSEVIVEQPVEPQVEEEKVEEQPTETVVTEQPVVNQTPETQKVDGKLIISVIIRVLIIFVLFITLMVLSIFLLLPKRDKVLTKDDNSFTYKISNDEFSIVSNFSTLMDKGYYVLDSNYKIKYDSISITNIYKDNKAYALAAFYCPDKDGCEYKDTRIVKLNLYKDSGINFKDVTYDSSKNNVFDKLGKETGKLVSDELYYIWTNGKSVGDPYIMVKFNSRYKNQIDDIKIGVWWYDGEYNHTVKEA